MAPMMQTAGIVLLLALSCHAQAPQQEQKKNSCEGWPGAVDKNGKENYTKVNGYYKITSNGQDELYHCGLFPLVRRKSVIKCLDGEWKKCIRVCSKPENMFNAVLKDQDAHYPAGSKATYTCAIGYAHTGGKTERTCKYSTLSWSPLKMQCKRKLCGSAGEVSNGDVVYTGTQFGDTATVVCADGHTLVGKATRTCLTGGWDGRSATCEAIHCTEPETNAERASGVRDSYAYREVIFYRCRQGSLLGQKAIWCTEDGSWSHPAPTCRVSKVQGECPLPSVAHADLSGARVPPFRHRAMVRITCHPGYKLVGSAASSCSPQGSWTPALPECR